VEQGGLEDAVLSTGWLAIEDLRRAPAAADLGVVIRSPSAGETSAAAARFLACGTPVAITARAQFLELPVAVAARITPGPAAAADLARAVIATARSKGSRDEGTRGDECRASWAALHSPERAAAALVAAVSELA
jgi:hypothetical protein